jgi:hypothetical protein
MYTVQFIKYVMAIEAIKGKPVQKYQLPAVLKCLELGYSAQTTASLI